MLHSEEEKLKYQIALTQIPNVGCVTAKTLVSYCGSVEKVFKEKTVALMKIPGVGEVTANAIHHFKDFKRAEDEIKFIEKYKITPLFYLDKEYPQRLKSCIDAPVMLYYKGNADLNATKMIALVGTRKATEYGKHNSEKIVEGLKLYNATVVSGLAYGIDIAAHKAALKNELPTIGVLAHGLDRIYPATHRSIAEKMIQHGGLLAEYMSLTNPDRENFPSRNRIVAGICDAVVVIEASETGGALITATIATNYNRDVFALPGRNDDTYSKGCNKFIKSNRAALIENADDIAYQLGWLNDAEKPRQKIQRELFIELTDEEKVLVEFLKNHNKSGIDAICIESKLTSSKVANVLLNLEFKGVVKSLPGKIYELL